MITKQQIEAVCPGKSVSTLAEHAFNRCVFRLYIRHEIDWFNTPYYVDCGEYIEVLSVNREERKSIKIHKCDIESIDVVLICGKTENMLKTITF